MSGRITSSPLTGSSNSQPQPGPVDESTAQEVEVTTLTGKKMLVKANPADSLGFLKTRYSHREGLPVDQQTWWLPVPPGTVGAQEAKKFPWWSQAAGRLEPELRAAMLEKEVKEFMDITPLSEMQQQQGGEPNTPLSVFMVMRLRAPDPSMLVNQADVLGRYGMESFSVDVNVETTTGAQLYALVRKRRAEQGTAEAEGMMLILCSFPRGQSGPRIAEEDERLLWEVGMRGGESMFYTTRPGWFPVAGAAVDAGELVKLEFRLQGELAAAIHVGDGSKDSAGCCAIQ
jgi:hypothetical protein